MKKVSRLDSKSQGNPKSEDLDASFSDSPSQISNITNKLSTTSSNSVIAAAGSLYEVKSIYSNVPLLLILENSSDQSYLPEFPPTPLVEPVGAATENVKETSTSIVAVSFIEEIVEGGGSCTEEMLTELSEVAAQPEAQIITGKCSKKDGGESLDVVLAGFLSATDKLCDAIGEMLVHAIEQRKRRNRNDGDFFLVRLGEMTLAFLIGAALVFILLTEVAPVGEFNGPTPT